MNNLPSDGFIETVDRIIKGARAPSAGQIKVRVFRQLEKEEAAPCPRCNNQPWLESGFIEYHVYCDYVHCGFPYYGVDRNDAGAIDDWNETVDECIDDRGECGLMSVGP